MERFSEDIGSDSRFRVFLKSLERLGSSNDDIIPVIDDRKFLNEILWELNKKIVSLKLNLYGADQTQVGDYVCYASLFNAFVIRADGNIGKCTVALKESKNFIGKLNENGKISINMDKFEYWTRGQHSMIKTELACPYFDSKTFDLWQL